MGICFSGWEFSSPKSLDSFEGAAAPALYCFSIIDTRCTPLPFQPLFFGEAADGSALDIYHQVVSRWRSMGGMARDLFVSVVYVPQLSEEERQAEGERLVGKYQTPLNTASTRSKGSNRVSRV